MSQKLKGSHIFTAWSAMVESNRVVEDSGTKAEEAEKAESSDGEDLETSSGVGGAYQSVGYIVHFANMSQAVSEEKLKLFQMWQSWSRCERLSEGS